MTMRRLLLGSITLCCLTQVGPAQGTWTLVQPAASPPARWQHAMAHDFVLARTVLFGGRPANNSYLNDTWEYDGRTWTQIQTSAAPSARWMSDMEYDAARLKTVLFGGYIQGQSQGDTWTYDSIQKTWTAHSPPTSPPPRYASSMAYDPDRKVVVLFGGQDGGTYLSDTWEWDGTNWTQVQTPNSPAGRTTSMAYDRLRQRMVVFGGSYSINKYDNETWEFDGKTWTQVTPTRSPSARAATSIEYDPVSQRIVMFGGFLQTFQNVDETWTYDGVTWTRLNPLAHPTARRDFDHIVLDPFTNRLRIFGGLANAVSAETWEFASNPTLTGSPTTISVTTGGTQTLGLSAGASHANRSYWVVGSVSGTSPGTPLGSLTIPVNFDVWTTLTIAFANSAVLTNTRGTLSAAGEATATLNVPVITDPSAIGLVLHHAYFVYDAGDNYYLASNPIGLRLTQ